MGKAGALTLQVAATTIGNDLGAFLHDFLLGLGFVRGSHKKTRKSRLRSLSGLLLPSVSLDPYRALLSTRSSGSRII
jgi:hypothetical protein